MVKCDKCSKPASLHITEIENGVPAEVHLCENCAQEYLAQGLAGPTPTIDGVQALGADADAEGVDGDISCPRCGLTFAEFRRTGRLGCSDDYEVFGEPLEALYENVHGATQHVGKAPQRSGEDLQRQQELIRLRQELREAIAKEAYEDAAKLRDRIQQREGQ